VTVLAASAIDPGPGVIAFLIVAAIGLALYFLIKSMNRQISKIQVPHEADLKKAERRDKRRQDDQGDADDDFGSEDRPKKTNGVR
jgi:hypothetical protein